jgi:hypothetical protein
MHESFYLNNPEKPLSSKGLPLLYEFILEIKAYCVVRDAKSQSITKAL